MSAALAPIEMIERADAANEPTGSAVATLEQLALQGFQALEAKLPELEERYRAVVYPVATTKGMKDAVAARAEVRTPRLQVKPLVKEMKAMLRQAGERVEAKGEALIASFQALEDSIDQQIKAQEKIKADEAAEAKKLKDEQNRIAQEIIETIRNRKELAQGQTPATILDIRSALNAIDLSEHDLGNRATEAARAKAEALADLGRMHVQAVEWVETQRVARIKADIERFERAALNAIGAPSSAIATAIASTEAIEVTTERFQEFVPQASAARARVIMQLKALHGSAITDESAAALAAQATQLDAQREALAQAQAQVGRVQAAQAAQVSTIASERSLQIASALRAIELTPGRYRVEMDAAVLADAIEQLYALPMSVSIYGGKIIAAREAVKVAVATLKAMHEQAAAREVARVSLTRAAPPPPAQAEPADDVNAIVLAALRGMLKLVDDTQGVVGYLEHRGVKLWEDIPAVAAAESAMAMVNAQAGADDSAPF